MMKKNLIPLLFFLPIVVNPPLCAGGKKYRQCAAFLKEKKATSSKPKAGKREEIRNIQQPRPLLPSSCMRRIDSPEAYAVTFIMLMAHMVPTHALPLPSSSYTGPSAPASHTSSSPYTNATIRTDILMGKSSSHFGMTASSRPPSYGVLAEIPFSESKKHIRKTKSPQPKHPPSLSKPAEIALTPEARELEAAIQYFKEAFRTSESKDYKILTDKIPEFSSKETISSFYKDILRINGGSSHSIFQATLAQDRGEVKKGTLIALRIRSVSSKKDERFFPRAFEASMHLSRLQGITDYIPPIYGVYVGPYDFALKSSHCREGYSLLVTEMELIDSDFETEYDDKRNPMSSRVAFEEVIGRWAVSTKAHCHLSDPDGDVLRHHVLKKDPDHLVVHMGKKSYLFPPGYSPRQVDFDYFGYITPPTTKMFEEGHFPHIQDYLSERVDSPSMKAFLKQVPEQGLLQSAYDNLKEFEVSDLNPLPKGPVKHRYISEEDLLT